MKRRGNGTGSVYKLPSGKWRGAVTLGTYLDDDGKLHRKVSSRNFRTKKEAVEWVTSPEAKQERKKVLTLKELYDLWKESYSGSKSATDVYKAAFDKYRPVWHMKLSDLEIDDLQECIDTCQRGKQTRENMKTVINLMYKHGIPRHVIPENLNLAQFLKPGGEKGNWKEGLPLDVVARMPEFFGSVPFMEYVYAQCYLGFRPGELLELDCLNYDRKRKTLTGGFKTEAGRNRTVTISPKIQPIIDRLATGKISGPLFCDENGKRLSKGRYQKAFDRCLDALGLENPELEQNGKRYRKFTPHSCRHTFATLMKAVPGSTTDKLALIGHTSESQMRDYQDISIASLRAITDAI